MSAAPLIRFEGVRKRFGAAAAVDGVDLDIAAGEFFVLLGPSGCGKTTLMRMLAGFETPDEGRVLLDGEDLAGRPPERRPVNMMFQSYALFPHMSVAANVAYGLKREGLGKADAAARVTEMLALVKLDGLGARRPDQLSGGQRQRVALARALAKRPRVLLLDEPLAALDRRLREETRAELKAIQARLGTTFLMVTHDQDEAMGLADRMAIMRRGALAQVGTPSELYQRPVDREVASFLGEVNLLPEEGGGWLAVRPEKIVLYSHPVPNPRRGQVTAAVYLGDRTHYTVRLEDGVTTIRALRMNSDNADPLIEGQKVFIYFQSNAATLLTK